MPKIDKNQRFPHSFQANFQESSRTQGRKWVNVRQLNGRSKIKDAIEKIQNLKSEFLHTDSSKTEKEILDFYVDMTVLNQAANQYNQRWYIRLLSCFTQRFKVATLEGDLEKLHPKAKEIQCIKTIPILLSKLNLRVQTLIEEKANKIQKGLPVSVPDALFRIPGNDVKATQLSKEFLENPTMDLANYSNDDIASALKKIFIKEMPDVIATRIQRSGIHRASTVEEANNALRNLSPDEKALCLNLFELLSNTYKYYWESQNGATLEGMLIAAPFIKKLFPDPSDNLLFIIQNQSAIKG